jgi:cell division protein FtsB
MTCPQLLSVIEESAKLNQTLCMMERLGWIENSLINLNDVKERMESLVESIAKLEEHVRQLDNRDTSTQEELPLTMSQDVPLAYARKSAEIRARMESNRELAGTLARSIFHKNL